MKSKSFTPEVDAVNMKESIPRNNVKRQKQSQERGHEFKSVSGLEHTGCCCVLETPHGYNPLEYSKYSTSRKYISLVESEVST